MTASADAPSDDPRALRSRRRLQEALRTLLRQEELGDLGVSELCREAGVHRTTFYGHYASVGELAADVYASLIDEIFPEDPADGQDPQAIARIYFDGKIALMRRVAEERRPIRALLASPVSLEFRRLLRERYREHVSRAIAVLRRSGGGEGIEGSAEVAGAFIAGGTLSAVEMWAMSDDEDAEAFVRDMMTAMPRWWPSAE
ncbi:TetR/AcrR family transcriptional regulator [Microbacterium sp. gxy059]|uniref:TetR/AcrR family transcriptional regulator n=1 Tax=Microbacterium sp. gxy059 TaxID=2957199 RepID=UPI003D990D9D